MVSSTFSAEGSPTPNKPDSPSAPVCGAKIANFGSGRSLSDCQIGEPVIYSFGGNSCEQTKLGKKIVLAVAILQTENMGDEI